MNYQQYGISKELVERVKKKMKIPANKERVSAILDGVTKQDLQNRAKISKKLNAVCKALGENPSEQQKESIVHFVIEQKIDPNNTFHLIKLWGMFR